MSAGPVVSLAAHTGQIAAPVEPSGEQMPPITAPVPPRSRSKRVNWLALFSFFFLVLLPCGIIGTYYIAHSADQFTVTAQFTVRETRAKPLSFEETEGAPDRVGSGFATETVSHFTHVAASYLESRALLDDLAHQFDVREFFQRPEADHWARLPPNARAEELLDYFQDRTRVSVDGPSGIVTFKLRAFRPDDALALSSAALTHAEQLINRLALRQKREALSRAEAEAAESDRRLQASIAALSAFRDTSGLLDPEQEGAETVQLLSQLTTEKIRLESELRVLESVVNLDAARARALKKRIAKIVQDMAQLRDQLASGATADDNLAAALGRFEELEIRRRFAAKLFGLAQTRLIDAEIDLARQSVFLNVFDPPVKPDASNFPKRGAFLALAFVALTIGWAILALIWASVADHRLDARRA